MANVKFSELALNSATSAAVRTQVANGVKVYRVLLSQTGTSDPTPTVLENSLGGVPAWTRFAGGVYKATLTGAFPLAKTASQVSSTGNEGVTPPNGFRISNEEFPDALYVITDVDDVLNATPVEILIYP